VTAIRYLKILCSYLTKSENQWEEVLYIYVSAPLKKGERKMKERNQASFAMILGFTPK
jgi:hypothetical protein